LGKSLIVKKFSTRGTIFLGYWWIQFLEKEVLRSYAYELMIDGI